MKLSFFGKLIVAVGCLFFLSIVTWLIVNNALTLEPNNWVVPAIAIAGIFWVLLIGFGIAFNINAYTTKKTIHIKKFICETECEHAFWRNCQKSCAHARPHTRTAQCDDIGCVPVGYHKRLT